MSTLCDPNSVQATLAKFFRQEYWRRVAISFSGDSIPTAELNPRLLYLPCIDGRILSHWAFGSLKKVIICCKYSWLQWSSRAILSFWQYCLGAHIVEHIYLLKTLILPTLKNQESLGFLCHSLGEWSPPPPSPVAYGLMQVNGHLLIQVFGGTSEPRFCQNGSLPAVYVLFSSEL